MANGHSTNNARRARRNVTASQRALAITTIYAWHPVGANKYSGRVPGTLPQKTNAELAAIADTSAQSAPHTSQALSLGFFCYHKEHHEQMLGYR